MDLNFQFAASLNKDTINQQLILWYCFEMLEKSYKSILTEEVEPNYLSELKPLMQWWLSRRDYYGDNFLEDQEMLTKLINLRKYL